VGDDGVSGVPLPRLLSVANVAAIFGRSTRTIRSWIRQGYLQPVRIGRVVFFREGDIRALITGRLSRDILVRSPRQHSQRGLGQPKRSSR
jgi:predicted DNA-binding transcriptional regulator AlpA